MIRGFCVVFCLVCCATIAAQDAKEIAFVECEVEALANDKRSKPRLVREAYLQEPLRFVVRVGFVEAATTSHLIQPFRQPLDVPASVELAWLTRKQERGKEIWRLVGEADVGLGAKPALTRSIALNGSRSQAVSIGKHKRAGRSFDVFEIRRVLLPLRAGALELGSAKLAFAYASSFRENFFGDREPVDRRDLELTSSSLELNIVDWPAVNRPRDFGGAVGRLTLNASVAETANTIELALRVRGIGNFTEFEAPRLTEQPGFDAFHIRGLVDNTANGERLLRYELVRTAPAASVPVVSIPFWDPMPPARYREAKSAAIRLTTKHSGDQGRKTNDSTSGGDRDRGTGSAGVGERSAAGPRASSAEPSKDSVRLDLYELIPAERVRSSSSAVGLSPTWILIFLVAPWLAGLAYFLWRRGEGRRRELARRAYVAGAVADFHTRLRQLETANGSSSRPAALIDAFASYFERRLGAAKAAVIAPDLAERLRAARVDAALAERGGRTLDALLAARYGGRSLPSTSELAQLVDEIDAALGNEIDAAPRDENGSTA